MAPMERAEPADLPTVIVKAARCPRCGSDRHTTKGNQGSSRLLESGIRQKRVTCKGLVDGKPCGKRFIILQT